MMRCVKMNSDLKEVAIHFNEFYISELKGTDDKKCFSVFTRTHRRYLPRVTYVEQTCERFCTVYYEGLSFN